MFFPLSHTNQTKLLRIEVSRDPPSNLSFLYCKIHQPCEILYTTQVLQPFYNP